MKNAAWSLKYKYLCLPEKAHKTDKDYYCGWPSDRPYRINLLIGAWPSLFHYWWNQYWRWSAWNYCRETARCCHPGFKPSWYDGTELCQRILKSKPETKILILSAFIEKDLVHFCIKAGVKGYLVKDAAVLNLPQHILDIMQGHTIFDPRITKMLTEFIQDREPDYAKLTLREIDVLRLISQGFTNHEIAIHLHLTENTVKGYVKEIYSKLDVHNRIEAVAKARKNWIL